MSLQVSARRRADPATSTASAAGWARSAAASSSAIGEHIREQQALAGPLLAELLQGGEDVLLGLRAEALEAPDPLALGGGAQLLE